MGIYSADVDIFHGTQRAFDSIRLPTEDLNIPRHAGDEYGVGFYTAITPDDPARAQSYAQSYTDGRGLVLHARISAGQIALLNLDENLGAETADRLRTHLQALDTGNPELDRYYQHVAAGITPETNGRNVWSALSEAGPYTQWHRQQHAVTLDVDETNAKLRADRRTLYQALETHGIELADIQAFTPEQVSLLQDNLRALNTDNPIMHRYYNEVADNLRVGTRGSIVIERLNRASAVQSSVDAAIPTVDSHAIADVMDRHATSVLNNAGIDGVIIPNQDTAVFKGRPAIDRLPDFSVVEIVGGGPAQDRIHTDRTIAVGEVLIPAAGRRAESSPMRPIPAVNTAASAIVAGPERISTERSVAYELVDSSDPSVIELRDPQSGQHVFAKINPSEYEADMVARASRVQLPPEVDNVHIPKLVSTDVSRLPPEFAGNATSVIIVEKAQGNDLQSIELGRRMPGTRYDVPELRDFTMSQNDFSSLETAVRAMNEQGVFHTDLKNRSNIFVHHDEQGRTHFSLIDWGGPHDAGMRQNDIEALSAGRDALLANGILSESTVAPQQAIKLPTEQERAAAASMWGDIARQYAPETIERRSDGSVGAGMRSSVQGPQADVAQTAPAASENWDYGAKPGELTDKFGRPLRTDSRTGKPADPIAGGRALWEQRMAEADEVARRTAEGEARTTPVERPVTPPTAQVEVHPTHTVPAAVAAAAVGASTADTAATVGRGGHAGDAHVRTVHGISTGVGAALGVYGLSQKVGRDGTLQSDWKAGGAQAGLAVASTVGDTTAIAADTVGMLRGSGAVGAVARRAALPVAVVAGALETGTAIAARDGHRAATAAGATAGGILGGMAAGAATGLVFGSLVPGAGNVVGAFVGGVVGLAGGLVGAYYGGKAADAVAGAALDQRLNADIDTPLNAMAGQLQRLGYTKMLDKDGDGKIEAHEVRQFVGADGVRDLRAAAKNGLTVAEVSNEIKQQLTENYSREMKSLIEEAKQKGWTKRLDANHDGKLDMSDVRANLAKTGVRLDANLDGHISGGEFIRAQTTPAKPAQAATAGHGHR